MPAILLLGKNGQVGSELQRSLAAAGDLARLGRQEADFMDDLTRKFILEKMRSKKGAILDAVGNLGNWPFRRTISYHVGVNCDSIEARDGYLRVQRRGRTIAIAEMPPRRGLLQRLWRNGWNSLMHPRHDRTSIAGHSQELRWEDMLRPRRPK